jgi:catechol 2,3-dioxygenase-like lactoylglutathione lyase family enzyme
MSGRGDDAPGNRPRRRGARGRIGARCSTPVDLNHLNLRVRDPAACRDFYQEHFEFRPAFEADGGCFVRNDDGFLLALIPTGAHQPLPDGFHIGFRIDSPERVAALRDRLVAGGVRVSQLDDYRPTEPHLTFRCWDPDGTEVEIFWEA